MGDSRLRIPSFRHLDEGKSARLAGIPILHDIHALYRPILTKSSFEVCLGGLMVEVSDECLGQRGCPFGIKWPLSESELMITNAQRRSTGRMQAKTILS